MNWLTDFSSWQDFRELLRSVVEKLNRNLATPEDVDAFVENIEITENNAYILQSFTVKARRKKFKRLKEVAAYNVGLDNACAVKFVNTYSQDYIPYLYEN